MLQENKMIIRKQHHILPHQLPFFLERTQMPTLLTLLILLRRKKASALEGSRRMKGHVSSDRRRHTGSSLSPLRPRHPGRWGSLRGFTSTFRNKHYKPSPLPLTRPFSRVVHILTAAVSKTLNLPMLCCQETSVEMPPLTPSHRCQILF